MRPWQQVTSNPASAPVSLSLPQPVPHHAALEAWYLHNSSATVCVGHALRYKPGLSQSADLPVQSKVSGGHAVRRSQGPSHFLPLLDNEGFTRDFLTARSALKEPPFDRSFKRQHPQECGRVLNLRKARHTISRTTTVSAPPLLEGLRCRSVRRLRISAWTRNVPRARRSASASVSSREPRHSKRGLGSWDVRMLLGKPQSAVGLGAKQSQQPKQSRKQ